MSRDSRTLLCFDEAHRIIIIIIINRRRTFNVTAFVSLFLALVFYSFIYFISLCTTCAERSGARATLPNGTERNVKEKKNCLF